MDGIVKMYAHKTNYNEINKIFEIQSIKQDYSKG